MQSAWQPREPLIYAEEIQQRSTESLWKRAATKHVPLQLLLLFTLTWSLYVILSVISVANGACTVSNSSGSGTGNALDEDDAGRRRRLSSDVLVASVLRNFRWLGDQEAHDGRWFGKKSVDDFVDRDDFFDRDDGDDKEGDEDDDKSVHDQDDNGIIASDNDDGGLTFGECMELQFSATNSVLIFYAQSSVLGALVVALGWAICKSIFSPEGDDTSSLGGVYEPPVHNTALGPFSPAPNASGVQVVFPYYKAADATAAPGEPSAVLQCLSEFRDAVDRFQADPSKVCTITFATPAGSACGATAFLKTRSFTASFAPDAPKLGVEFDPDRPACLAVVKADPEGQAFAAGLRAGCVILSVSAISTTSDNTATTTAAAAASSGPDKRAAAGSLDELPKVLDALFAVLAEAQEAEAGDDPRSAADRLEAAELLAARAEPLQHAADTLAGALLAEKRAEFRAHRVALIAEAERREQQHAAGQGFGSSSGVPGHAPPHAEAETSGAAASAGSSVLGSKVGQGGRPQRQRGAALLLLCEAQAFWAAPMDTTPGAGWSEVLLRTVRRAVSLLTVALPAFSLFPAAVTCLVWPRWGDALSAVDLAQLKKHAGVVRPRCLHASLAVGAVACLVPGPFALLHAHWSLAVAASVTDTLQHGEVRSFAFSFFSATCS